MTRESKNNDLLIEIIRYFILIDLVTDSIRVCGTSGGDNYELPQMLDIYQ